MANMPSQPQSGVDRLIGYVKWRMAGKPFTHGAAGYDAWMEAYDPLFPTKQDVGVVSIICPVHDPHPDHLEQGIRSALEQSYKPIELILIDDGSARDTTAGVLDRFRHHPNVTVVSHEENRGIAASLNTGIEAASGEVLVFLDHDDVLAPDAVAWLGTALADADVAYTDEDQITPEGDRVQPFLKPAWSPMLLLGMNYVNHATAIKKATIESLGGFNDRFSGAQDHDLMLRVAESGAVVVHVPKVLYHWRQSPESVAHDVDAKPWALDAARACVASSLERRGVAANVIDAPEAGPYRFAIRFAPQQPAPRIITGANELTMRELNELVTDATQDTIMFVPGHEVPDDKIVTQLSGWLRLRGVAACGPMILDTDGRVAEAGWTIDHTGASPYGAGRVLAPEPFLEVARDTTALGGRYLVVARDHFLAVGGFTEGRTLTEAGVDLTFKLTTRLGLTCVADSTIRIRNTTPDPISLISPTMTEQDKFVSPHVGTDGIEIAAVPDDIAARRVLLGLRDALPPTA